MDDRRTGAILVAVGLVVGGIGVAGFVSDRGAGAAVAVSSPAPSSTRAAAGPSGPTATATAPGSPTTLPSPTARPTPLPTSTPTAAPDPAARVRAFYTVLAPAIRTADVETLIALLHPATLERYGAAGCRATFAGLADPAYALVIKTVHDPAPWEYARDGLTTTIPDALAVEVDVTTAGGTAAAVFHVAPVEGEIRWFADCGTPVGGSPAP